MEIISIRDIPGFKIGQVQNEEAGTGCTVVLCERGAAAGLDVRGGGPASRESELLKPLAAAGEIHAVLLAGGSAFGLDAAGGVMQYLEERGIGVEAGGLRVPLVCQSDIFDLGVADSRVRPDRMMGYEACKAAERGNYRDGCFGAGTGATVGKLYGMEYCMKSGIGSYAVRLGSLMMGALAVVNALGDVYDWRTGRPAAGLLSEDKQSLRPTAEAMYRMYEEACCSRDGGCSNTTIGAVLTNADFPKASLCKIAGMTHNGYARAIRPVHTAADGDSIYALSCGGVTADLNLVGTLAAEVMAEAVLNAVRSAQPAYGYPAYGDFEDGCRKENR